MAIYSAPSAMAADFAKPGVKAVVSMPDEEIEKMVARADREMHLRGELVAFFTQHRDAILGKEIPRFLRQLSDAEWGNFLNGEFRGRRWKAWRGVGWMEWVVVVEFG